MWVRSIWAQGRTASVPPEMVKFISHVRHIDPAHDLTIFVRRAVHIHYEQSVGTTITVGIYAATYASFSAGACIASLGEG